MRSLTRKIGFAIAVACVFATSAGGVVKPTLEGALRTFCADGIAAHPNRATLTTVIAVDRFESSEKVVLAAFYGPHPATQGPRGELTAKATLFKAAGGRKKLGTLKGRQEAANTPILLLKVADTALMEGDVIRWDFTLSGFGQLVGGCFNVAALVGPDE